MGNYDLYTLYTGVPKEDAHETLENQSNPFKTSYRPMKENDYSYYFVDFFGRILTK